MVERRLRAFNSGAVVRVSAIREMGGFATEFPLDYLDQATFAELQERGGRVFLLRRLRLLRAVLGRLLRAKRGAQTWRMLRSAVRP